MPLTDLEQRICDALASRADDLYADLERQVAIPTGMGYGPGLREYRDLLVERLTDLRATVTQRESLPRPDWLRTPSRHGEDGEDAAGPDQNIIVARGSSKGAASGPRILITGHIDTVHDPHGSFRELTRSPDGATATGPGAVDMKGGIVICLAALEALAAAGVDINWTFMLNADEETGSFQSEAVIRELSRQHDWGIALEPALADGSLAIERMGSGQFMIETFGRSAHVGREFEKGISAVTALGDVLVALGRMPDPQKGMIVNVGPLEGGKVTNAVPDHAACWGNVRYANATTGEALGRLIDALSTIDNPRASDVDDQSLPRTVVHRHWNRPAKPLTPEVERFAHLARAAAEDIGQSLPFAKTGGVCDGNIMQDAGLPTLDTLGVRGGNLHRTDEFIEIASLVERAQLLAVLLARLSSPSEA